MPKLRDDEQYQHNLAWYDDEDMNSTAERSFWYGIVIGTIFTSIVFMLGLIVKFA